MFLMLICKSPLKKYSSKYIFSLFKNHIMVTKLTYVSQECYKRCAHLSVLVWCSERKQILAASCSIHQPHNHLGCCISWLLRSIARNLVEFFKMILYYFFISEYLFITFVILLCDN